MSQCTITSYNDIPADPTIHLELREFVDQRVHEKLESLGDQNPCYNIQASQYETSQPSPKCQAAIAQTRLQTIPYIKKALLEAAARQLNPFFNSQMTTFDTFRLKAIQQTGVLYQSLSLAERMTPNFAGAWISFKVLLGFGDEKDFLESMKAGTNIACIGDNNICDEIDRRAQELAAPDTEVFNAKKEAGCPKTAPLLSAEDVIIWENNDPDDCKHDLNSGARAFLHQWMTKLNEKLHPTAVAATATTSAEAVTPQSALEVACGPFMDTKTIPLDLPMDVSQLANYIDDKLVKPHLATEHVDERELYTLRLSAIDYLESVFAMRATAWANVGFNIISYYNGFRSEVKKHLTSPSDALVDNITQKFFAGAAFQCVDNKKESMEDWCRTVVIAANKPYSPYIPCYWKPESIGKATEGREDCRIAAVKYLGIFEQLRSETDAKLTQAKAKASAKPAEPVKKAAPAIVLPTPVKKAAPAPSPKKVAPPAEPRPAKPAPKATPADDGGILKI